MPRITLAPASPQDIPAIQQLADITWRQHYTSIISQAQIDYMLEKMYSAGSLEEQMLKKGHRFYFVCLKAERIGFISVSLEKDNTWFLNKFYINQDYAGKGTGAMAFELLLALLSPGEITLTVNRQNFKSINFYFKLGFKILRVEDFDIGNGYQMNDFVMTWRTGKF